jgi:hypothetical protein
MLTRIGSEVEDRLKAAAQARIDLAAAREFERRERSAAPGLAQQDSEQGYSKETISEKINA